MNTWVYNSTESVLLIILLHGWYNTVNAYLVLSSQNALPQTLSGILLWALAIALQSLRENTSPPGPDRE